MPEVPNLLPLGSVAGARAFPGAHPVFLPVWGYQFSATDLIGCADYDNIESVVAAITVLVLCSSIPLSRCIFEMIPPHL